MATSSVFMFFSANALLEGRGIAEARSRVTENFVPTIKRSWVVFTPAQLINFSIVPPGFRVLFVGMVALCWNTYLSSVNAALAAHSKHIPTMREVADAGIIHPSHHLPTQDDEH